MEWNESEDALLGNILSGEYSAYFGLKNLNWKPGFWNQE